MKKQIPVYIFWTWNNQDYEYAWEDWDGNYFPFLPVNSTITVDAEGIAFILKVAKIEAHYRLEPVKEFAPLSIDMICEVTQIEG